MLGNKCAEVHARNKRPALLFEPNELRPHYWLYEKYAEEDIKCENCVRYEEGCGMPGMMCGSFELSDQIQITMEGTE